MISRDVGLQLLENKALSRGIIGKSAPTLAETTIRKSQTSEQLELFASPTHQVAEAMDKINDRWGEFVVIPALMMGMGDIILDRISFGGVKELEEVYSE